MATATKVLYRGAAATSSTTLYTVPSTTTTVVSNIAIVNTSSGTLTYNLLLNDIALASGTLIGSNDTVVLDLKQVLSATQTIKGSASATTVNFHISGVEIS